MELWRIGSASIGLDLIKMECYSRKHRPYEENTKTKNSDVAMAILIKMTPLYIWAVQSVCMCAYDICMCTWLWMYPCVFMWTLPCMCIWRTEVVVSMTSLVTVQLIFEAIALLSLELTISARLAGQQILGFYLAIPLWLWGYNSFPPCLASYMNTRSLNSALFTCLHSRDLAIWVMSPAMPVSYTDGNLVIRIGECFVLRMGVPSSPKGGPATSRSTLSAPLVLLVSAPTTCNIWQFTHTFSTNLRTNNFYLFIFKNNF